MLYEGAQVYENTALERRRAARHTAVMPARVKLFNRLAELRQAAGLSQAELAERIGKSQQQVDRLEEPAYGLRASQLSDLAAALGCHPFELLLPRGLWPRPEADGAGPGAAVVDRGLLALVITESEAFLAAERMTLAAGKKAELYMAVHDWMAAQGASDARTAREDIGQIYGMMRVLIA